MITRGNYVAAVLGCVIANTGWFISTDIFAVRVITAILIVSWLWRLVWANRQPDQRVTVTASLGMAAEYTYAPPKPGEESGCRYFPACGCFHVGRCEPGARR